MKSRKSKIISSINLIAEERYLNSKFNLKEEEENNGASTGHSHGAGGHSH